MKPTLIIMAAGIGSRYGGLKQIDPVGPSGEPIIEYSVYDAVRAGFGDVIFVINKQIDGLFREMIGARIPRTIPVHYVHQCLEDIPGGCSLPTERVKPWGTAHAVYSCRELLSGPFAAINADDFYGADAFSKIRMFISDDTGDSEYRCCMAGYKIENTLTENGHVARGVCQVTSDDYLSGITERIRIERRDGAIVYSEDDGSVTVIPPGTTVSMNIWGFPGSVQSEFEESFRRFLTGGHIDLLKAEFFLPLVVNELLAQGKASVKVLKTNDKWYGVTYREDKERVKNAISALVRAGKYPERLWSNGT